MIVPESGQTNSLRFDPIPSNSFYQISNSIQIFLFFFNHRPKTNYSKTPLFQMTTPFIHSYTITVPSIHRFPFPPFNTTISNSIHMHTHKCMLSNRIKIKQPAIRKTCQIVDQINFVANRIRATASIYGTFVMESSIVSTDQMKSIAHYRPICGIDQRRMTWLQTNWLNSLVC